MYVDVSYLAAHRDRQVSSKAIGAGSIGSRPTVAARRGEIRAAKLTLDVKQWPRLPIWKTSHLARAVEAHFVLVQCRQQC